MADVVQLKCPHCKNTLRVPADWVQRPVRCKHCQQVFQARPKKTPAADNPFVFDDDAPPPAKASPAPAKAAPPKTVPAKTPAPKAQGINPVKAILIGCGILS